jgi:exopolysaccharide biosynthesis polyprenyl glycosylphosphotransferase
LAYLVRAKLLVFWPSIWSGTPQLFPTYGILLAGTLPILLGSLYVAGGYYMPRLHGVMNILAAVLKGFALSTISVLAFAFALRDQTFSRAIVAGYLVLSFGGFFLIRLTARELMLISNRQGRGMINAVVVGTGPGAKTIGNALQFRPYLGYRLTGFVSVPDESNPDPDVPTLGTVDELPQLVDDQVVDAVFFGTSLDVTARHERTIWKLEEVGKTVHLRGDAVGVMLSRTLVGEFEGVPLLTLSSTPADPVLLGVKRAIDVVASLAGIVVLSPVLAATAAAVKLTSPGPLLFAQERVGLHGRRFHMLKFRSMFQDAERRKQDLLAQNEMDGPVFKIKNDPRITPVGRWIRKFSVDELPQLFNVLRGEMSLVGPRPPLPNEVDEYQRWHRRRLSMKPGLTCLWQVSGRNDIDFEQWMRLDMEYIDNWSLFLDMKILFRTIPVVVFAKGAH